MLSGLKKAIQRLELRTVVPRPDRRPVTGITAFYGVDAPTQPASIKNISSGGIFLNLKETLQPGQIVTLKLQMEGDQQLNSELYVTIQAKTVRQDESGAGFMFMPPAGLDPDLWEVLVHGTVVLTNFEQVAQLFHTLRTVLFLCRICPTGAEEAIALLDGRLDHDRTASLFRIAHAAENLLAADPDAGHLRAHPTLVANLLRDGSWATDTLTSQLWTGLFVSSCSVHEPDDSNQIFADMLVHTTPRQAVLFSYACEQALRSMAASRDLATASVVLLPNEIVQLTGMYDLTRNATDLAYLYNLGLIQNVFDFTSYRDFDHFDITPSRLGIELYNHCHGQRSEIDPQLIALAKQHLAVFLPQP